MRLPLPVLPLLAVLLCAAGARAQETTLPETTVEAPPRPSQCDDCDFSIRWAYDVASSEDGTSVDVVLTASFEHDSDSTCIEFYDPRPYDPYANTPPFYAVTEDAPRQTIWAGPVVAGDTIRMSRRYRVPPGTVMEFWALAHYEMGAYHHRPVHLVHYFATDPGALPLGGSMYDVRRAQHERRRVRKGLRGLTEREIYERDRFEYTFLVEPFQRNDIGVVLARASDSTLVACLAIPRWLLALLPKEDDMREFWTTQGALGRYERARHSGTSYDGLMLPPRAELVPSMGPEWSALDVPYEQVSFPILAGDAAGQIRAAWVALQIDPVRAAIQTYLDGLVPE